MAIKLHIKAGMLWTFAWLLLPYLPGEAFAQIYSVHHPSLTIAEANEGPALGRLELYAGPVFSLQPLKDDEGNTLSSAFYGLSAGARWGMLERLSLGLEGQYLPQTVSQIPFTQYVRQEALYLTARWKLTPDTLPLLWLEGGGGCLRTRWKLQLAFPAQELSSASVFVGVGGVFSLGRGWGGGFSSRLLYISRAEHDFLLHYASHTAWQVLLGLGKAF